MATRKKAPAKSTQAQDKPLTKTAITSLEADTLRIRRRIDAIEKERNDLVNKYNQNLRSIDMHYKLQENGKAKDK